MDVPQQESLDFEKLVKECFGFAEKAQMSFKGVRQAGGTDPRDAALVARYSGSEFRFDIGWNEFELSLSVLIKFDRNNWPNRESYVYLEPFVEYLSQGQEKAIVPYVVERMSVRSIEAVMERRKGLFAGGLEPVIRAIGKKMEAHFGDLMSVSQEQVQGYHKWMKSQISSHQGTSGNVRERQGTSGNVRERQGTSGNVRERQGTSGNVRERQGTGSTLET